MQRTLLCAAAVLALAGCAGGPAIDRTYSAVSQDSRVRYVILHYTHGDFPRAFEALTKGPVSSHYLIADQPPAIYQLVDESRRAYHAGDSAWKTDTQLNYSSIGIEIVNRGYVDTPEGRAYYAYPPEQISLLIDLLRHIAARHQVAPEHILGHNEIAPQRKSDPGPLFPWQRLAEAGLIRWPDPSIVAEKRAQHEQRLPDNAWFQQRLRQIGYVLPAGGQSDEATKNALVAFQMKYRPARYDGVPDAETAALLEALLPP
jgi:N-acetylmuramoyl-L-alanine amidase